MLTVDPVAINLAGGSYLKLGLALQFSLAYDEAAGGHEGGGAGRLQGAGHRHPQFSGAR